MYSLGKLEGSRKGFTDCLDLGVVRVSKEW